MPADAESSSPSVSELQRRIEELSTRLHESETRHALVSDAVAEGIYEWNIDSNALSVSPRLIEIFGFEGRELKAADWNKLVHPEDFPSYRTAVRSCLKGTSRRLDCEYRVKHADGAYRWIEDRAVAVRDKAGRAVRLVGAVSDVTVRKNSEHALRESLEQQTATGEVLKVISESPTDVQPVLDAVAKAALRFCGAGDVEISLRDGDDMVVSAHEGPVESPLDHSRLDRTRIPGRAIMDGRTIHVPDIEAVDQNEFRSTQAIARITKARAFLAAPMLREGAAIGAILLRRAAPGPFTPRQIELLQSFAAQAVIALENTRLFTELQQRTDDLAESLEQQTATADVLQAINASPGDLAPVFDTMLDKAMRLCEAQFGSLTSYDGERFHTLALRGLAADVAEAFRQPWAAGPGSLHGQLVRGAPLVHVDPLEDEDWKTNPQMRALHGGGARTRLLIALRKDGVLLGSLWFYRKEVRPFSEKQIALLQNFASQAVIAMENARLLGELRQRTDDLTESLEYQTATSEVLELISRSTSDIQPVLDSMVATATRLCGASAGTMAIRQADSFRHVSTVGLGAVFDKALRERPLVPRQGTISERVLLEKQIIHVADLEADPDYPLRDAAHTDRMRTALGVPLMREGELLGVFVVARDRVELFTDRQIGLIKTFADQAVIAMENSRLLGELRQRTEDLTESLEYQTATSELLEVISRSASNIQPVMDTILAAAARLCGTTSGAVAIRRDNAVRVMAVMGVAPEVEAALRERNHTDHSTMTGRTVLSGQVIHVDDVAADADYSMPEIVRIAQMRTVLGVPLLRDGEPVGAIIVSRSHVERFSERQIALIRTFADQAVIAMENARLLSELRTRTDDLAESLEYQTATSDVLKVISRSTFHLQSVLDTLSSTAARLCLAELSFMTRQEGDEYRFVTAVGSTPQTTIDAIRLKQDFLDQRTFRAGRASITGRVVAEAQAVQIVDIASDPEYALSEINTIGGIRTLLGVPMMREGSVVGTMSLGRQRVEPFTERQIELVRTFADQAVIALENARLLGELRESLDQQTATSDVLRTISRSSVDLAAVLDTLVETVARLCRADQAYMFRRQEGLHYLVASHGASDETKEYMLANPFTPDRGNTSGRVLMERRTVHIPDVLADPDYTYSEGQKIAGFRTMLGIPLMREDVILGVFVVSRTHVEPFSEKEIALATGFADQAVIAIENARLFEELRDRQAELRTTFDNIGDGVVMFDDQLRLAAWNRNFQALLDVSDDFLARRPSYDDFVRMLIERGEFGSVNREAETRRLLRDVGRQWSRERTRPDGRVIEVRNNPVPGGGTVAIYSDITKRKQAEAEIRAARDAAELALERQTATADILKVIASSPTDVQPVLDVVAKAAVQFCGATDAVIHLRDGDESVSVAHEGPVRSMGGRGPLDRQTTFGRAMLDRLTIQFPDVEVLDPVEFALPRRLARELGFRAVIGTPLLREGSAIGAITLRRVEPGPFTPQQIELLETFAAQAVIAIENVRLFTELRESLEQQTATAEILRVISQSPTDVQPVLDAVAKAAVRFCGATDALIQLRDGDSLIPRAHEGPLTYASERRLLDRSAAGGRAIVDVRTFHYSDSEELDPVEFATGREIANLHGFRAAVAAPLKREDAAIGAVILRKVEPGPFTQQQIELLETFAAQAVIAIENVRLFTELREALERQTATAEILRAISQSPTDVRPVFDEVVKAAVRFCGATDANIHMREGDQVLHAAHEGPLGSAPGTRRPLDRQTAFATAILDGRTIQYPDIEALDPVEFALSRRLAKEFGFRAVLAAPLLREGTGIGSIALRRIEPGPFTQQQIELLETFAAQAVIAIENVRLFTELRESLERLKAAQANLVQSEKMASLGQLTAGIAHEIKNPLNFVNNFAGLSAELVDELKQTVDTLLANPDENKRADLQDTMNMLTGNLARIIEHGQRADGIVKSMLAHSRGGTGDWQSSNINTLLEEALNLAFHGARAQDKDFNVTLERDLEATPKPIDVVPQDVTRVFLNLIGNGFYATRKRYKSATDNGYRPTLRVSTRDLGEGVEIRVRDNGTGITADVRQKLFQPFFTTKPTGEGTGLGLSISYDIVTQQHGGSIDVESEVGQFTEFTVRLPRMRRANAASAGEA
jgi:PAS domain S-box-containing protein